MSVSNVEAAVSHDDIVPQQLVSGNETLADQEALSDELLQVPDTMRASLMGAVAAASSVEDAKLLQAVAEIETTGRALKVDDYCQPSVRISDVLEYMWETYDSIGATPDRNRIRKLYAALLFRVMYANQRAQLGETDTNQDPNLWLVSRIAMWQLSNAMRRREKATS